MSPLLSRILTSGFLIAAALATVCQAQAIPVPAGRFVMGGEGGEPDERPAHTVVLNAFRIDRYEVTFAEYDSCVARGACTPAHYDDGQCLMLAPPGFRKVTVPDKYRSPRRPVVCVTWQQARAYCRSRGKRLPTEAEWEYAASAGAAPRYAWGGDSPSPDRCTPVSHMSPRDVGAYTPNAWGLHDMTGNVWEWTNDWYQRDYYAVSDTLDPRGSSVGQYRVVRGGGWYGGVSQLRVRNREPFQPTSAEASVGFRCAQ
jgi:formylglycine-generating enzyme